MRASGRERKKGEHLERDASPRSSLSHEYFLRKLNEVKRVKMYAEISGTVLQNCHQLNRVRFLTVLISCCYNDGITFRLLMWQIITFTLTAFYTEYYGDYFYIYDGYNTSAPVLAALSGSWSSSTWRSTQRFMFIRFTSNSYTTYSGFNATYSVLSIPGHIQIKFYLFLMTCCICHTI